MSIDSRADTIHVQVFEEQRARVSITRRTLKCIETLRDHLYLLDNQIV